jgi:hypothetical protein
VGSPPVEDDEFIEDEVPVGATRAELELVVG